MLTPEQIARQKIDTLLTGAGWVVQKPEEFNRKAALGVAVREFQLTTGPCDYLLFVDGKAAGVVEAKKLGVTLGGVADQSDKYMGGIPGHLARWEDFLVFDYESNSQETYFRNMRDPKPRSRRVFAFHRPETLHVWLKSPQTLRAALTCMPPLDETGLRDCQIDAIHGLEKSLAADKPRSLIQLATGAGKTFTACSFSYRLIKYAGAKRILFLVDRNNLGDQTLKEFQNYQPPGAANRFTDTYIVQHLHSSQIDPDAKVVITTIQRLFAMLKGEDLDEEAEEGSAFESWQNGDGEVLPLDYNPQIPIEMFDFIVTDECHRSIYGLWRQVLEYFDASIIGLTATPSKHTLGFFNQNLVAEYPYERSVADGVNVGYEVYRIRTRVTEDGGRVEVDDANFQIPIRDKRTRAVRYQELDADLDYSSKELDRSVVAPNQIRTVLETYKDRVFTELFPDRTGNWLPKTLIFAKDDNHAEEIVHAVREVFGEGNEFAKKITYRNTGERPKELIKAFRVDPFPRVAVTVDMIATGTDIKPVEVLIFMRDVKSEGYYEQMKGRGVRTIPDADLKSVTPDAKTKTRFILIDAVGVSETKKNASKPLERKKSLSFDQLVDQIAQGRRDEDALSSLAGRLAALDRKLSDEDRIRITEASEGKTLRDLANLLLDAIDVDKQVEVIEQTHGSAATPEQEADTIERLIENACAPFDAAPLRNLLKDIKKKNDIIIDEVTTDELRNASFDLKHAEERVESFKAFIEENKDELTALQIIYNQSYGQQRLTYAAIKELTRALTDPPRYLSTADVWQAYKRLDASKIKGAPVDQQLTEIVSLVRFALGYDAVLEPFATRVEQRFNLWLGREKNAGREYSTEQMGWLRTIAGFIAANAEIGPSDFMEVPSLSDKGGILKARELFGSGLNGLLDDIRNALVA
ncbi:DEAD/DEAH box helicase family protein [Agrobacterium tumefaciens]|uniref:type I restriction endonuclease subunit R n=1 Tax=Agrobacterium tumefaciens TaxID=358 RepID=UPI0021CEE898|nr:type I restriction-modification enzyme R subunit C-terminal domain-containing protein [Agrobacterium tumefaciens]UXS11608.1 DEAD/DEAH box helicase family protein [Agrobacterium tumefaciens]UXS18974.1 DEAD/DEAH box helicase family protein [Agrobacterium tumefaciens]UXT67613.1 DEAD/DEAH box helicase family protein [Agrobacterium tumefaciens]